MPRRHDHRVFWSAAVFNPATYHTTHVGFWATTREGAYNRVLQTFGDVQVLTLRPDRSTSPTSPRPVRSAH